MPGPRGSAKVANAPPREWRGRQMTRSNRGGEGGGGGLGALMHYNKHKKQQSMYVCVI